nr:cytochrome c3 family protein [uncultured Desulfuromonas sp.]
MNYRTWIFSWLPLVVLVAGVGLAQAGTDCFQCHDPALFSGKVTHRPVAKNQCDQCHNPHLAKFDGLLLAEGSDLCFQCHTGFKSKELDKKVIHQPVAEGQCNACHDPHASQTGGLLKRSMTELCLSCHTQIDEQPGKPHAPFAKGQCATCHLPHASDRRALLKKDNSALCLSCHQASAALRKQHLNRSLERVDCLECHQPHKSQRISLLRETLHQPFADGECQSCHARNNDLNLCLSCHEDVLSSFNHQFSHRVVGNQVNGCFNCHSPHASRQQGLIKEAEGQACRQCHEGKFQRREKSLYLHPGANTCVNCHQLHGSDLPAMRKKDNDSACISCHERHSNFSHPMGDKALDPRNGQPMNCISCHDPCNGTMFKYNLRGTSDKGLCILCHAGY